MVGCKSTAPSFILASTHIIAGIASLPNLLRIPSSMKRMRFTAASRKPGIAGGHYRSRASVDVFGASMAVGLYRVPAWSAPLVTGFENGVARFECEQF